MISLSGTNGSQQRTLIKRTIHIICIALLLCTLTYFESTCFVAARPHPSRGGSGNNAATEPVKLDEARLPPLQDVLKELKLTSKLKDFVRMGVTDTRLLLRLKRMDFNIMEMEWVDDSEGGITSGDIANLKKKVASMIEEYTLKVDVDKLREDRTRLLEERSLIKYGRLYIDNNIQSFDYALATFGAATPPVGPKRVFSVSEPNVYGCNTTEYTPQSATITDPAVLSRTADAYIIVHRGLCPFLAKATYMKRRYPNAAGLIIVNSDEAVEAPSSGYGVDPSVTDQHVEAFHKMHKASRMDYSVVSIARSSWAKIEKSIVNNAKYYTNSSTNTPIDLKVSLIPLQCGGSSATVAGGMAATGSSNPKHNKNAAFAAATAAAKASSSSTSTVGTGTCRPIMPEEHEYAHEVTCGNVQFHTTDGDTSSSPVFDFLAANVGATLPDSVHRGQPLVQMNDIYITMATPSNGCAALSLPPSMSSTTSTTTTVTTKIEGGNANEHTKIINTTTPAADFYANTVIVMTRGGCSFEQKLLNAQAVNALYVIIADNNEDNALQHIGVSKSATIPTPTPAVRSKVATAAGSATGAESPIDVVTVPSMLITKVAGDWVREHHKPVAENGSNVRVVLQLHRNNVNYHAVPSSSRSASGEDIDSTKSTAGAAVVIRPTIAHHWIELAHYPWVTADPAAASGDAVIDSSTGAPLSLQQQLEAYVLQVEVLIGKYLHLAETLLQSATTATATAAGTSTGDENSGNSSNSKDAQHHRHSKHYYANIIEWLKLRKQKALNVLSNKFKDNNEL